MIKFIEHKNILMKFMRNFEDVDSEKLSLEKSHLVHFEAEKEF